MNLSVRRCLMIFLVGICLAEVSLAEPVKGQPEQTNIDKKETGTEIKQRQDLAKPSQEPIEQRPIASQLKAREFGGAFKNFKPSEDISVDNAVSFPVDI